MIKIKGRPIKDVWHYFVGNYRYKVFYSGVLSCWLLRSHIKQQIIFRFDYVPIECWESGSCKECGCQVPHLQMAHKSCDADCYPELMNKEAWHDFKNNRIIRQKEKYWRLNPVTNVLTLSQNSNQYVPEHRPKIR